MSSRGIVEIEKIEADFKRTFPEATTPSYLVDFGADCKFEGNFDAAPFKWEIVKVQGLSIDDKQALLNQGWGAISYAYGADARKTGEVRPNYQSGENPPIPRGDELKTILTCLPKIMKPKVDPTNDKELDQYVWELKEIKKIFWSMKKRFLWWDLACVPQVDYALNPPMSEVRKKAAGAEIAKQKYVYGPATAGAIWLLKADFTKDDDKIKSVFRGPPLFDLKELDAGLPEADKAKTWLISILGTGSLESWGSFETALKSFLSAIDKITSADLSFSSIWCFQESKLMGPQIFVDRNGNKLGWDSKVATDADFLYTSVNGKKILRPGMPALAAMVTFLAAELSLAMVNPLDTRLPVHIRNVVKDADLALLDISLKKLSRSGLVYFPDNSPLELITAARRNRPHAFRYPDNKFNAMIGVLGLQRSSEYSGEPLALSKQFFGDLLAQYQWHMLFLAKLNKRIPEANKDLTRKVVDPVTRKEEIKAYVPPAAYESWASISEGLFEPIAAYARVFENNRSIGNLRESQALTYNADEDVVSVKYTLPRQLALVELTAAENITAYRMELDHGGKSRTQEADPYGPVVADFKTFKFSPEISNYVNVNKVLTSQITGREGEVFLKLYNLPNPSLAGTSVARYAAIRLTKEDYKRVQDAKKNAALKSEYAESLHGVFEGIVDIAGLEGSTIETTRLALHWQERGITAWEGVLTAPTTAQELTSWNWLDISSGKK